MLERIDRGRPIWLAKGNKDDRIPSYSSNLNIEVIDNCSDIPFLGNMIDEEDDDEANRVLLIITSATNLMEPLIINALSRVSNCILIGNLKSQLTAKELQLKIDFNNNKAVETGFKNLSFFRRMWTERPDLCFDNSK